MLLFNLVEDFYVGMTAGYNIRSWNENRKMNDSWNFAAVIYGGKCLWVREKIVYNFFEAKWWTLKKAYMG